METAAAIAFTRFGLGRRRDEPIPADPKAWLRAQLTGPDPAPTAGLATTSDAMIVVQNLQHRDKGEDLKTAPEYIAFTELEKSETQAFLAQAVLTPHGFRERLVWFWFNHFTVAARSRPTTACVGPYIREAIRPYVTGRFGDMLLAVMRHPAMLDYLDQQNSVGPDSLAGQRRHLGLNENLARESLELHTISPAAGYTQEDVTAYARVLTGWTWDRRNPPYGFVYQENLHEPGVHTVLGRTWPEGEAGGIALLDYLAHHPATYRHLAEKLVRHFVADDPPPRAVRRIEYVLAATQGDLGAAAAALVDLPEAWTPLTKLRTPQDYIVAMMRAVGAHPEVEPKLASWLNGLGQPLFKAPFPIGWPDRAADWASPEAILRRVELAYFFAARVNDQDPAAVAEATLGPLLDADTATAIRHAGSRRDGLTLLLACPDFQRR